MPPYTSMSFTGLPHESLNIPSSTSIPNTTFRFPTGIMPTSLGLQPPTSTPGRTTSLATTSSPSLYSAAAFPYQSSYSPMTSHSSYMPLTYPGYYQSLGNHNLYGPAPNCMRATRQPSQNTTENLQSSGLNLLASAAETVSMFEQPIRRNTFPHSNVVGSQCNSHRFILPKPGDIHMWFHYYMQ
ncbi:hypothetical protein BDQ17DRAFT_1347888 [Cyathus striatus]|nr:hypothetical protein BDQ17DRAFT_1347888 [Cyathus striatus]